MCLYVCLGWVGGWEWAMRSLGNMKDGMITYVENAIVKAPFVVGSAGKPDSKN